MTPAERGLHLAAKAEPLTAAEVEAAARVIAQLTTTEAAA